MMTRIEQICSESNARALARLPTDQWHGWDTPPEELTYEQWWAMEDVRLLASACSPDPDLYGIVRAACESAALHTIRQRWDDGYGETETTPDVSVAEHMRLMRRLPPEHPHHEEHELYRLVASGAPHEPMDWLREARAEARWQRQRGRRLALRSHSEALEAVRGGWVVTARDRVKEAVRYLGA